MSKMSSFFLALPLFLIALSQNENLSLFFTNKGNNFTFTLSFHLSKLFGAITWKSDNYEKANIELSINAIAVLQKLQKLYSIPKIIIYFGCTNINFVN